MPMQRLSFVFEILLYLGLGLPLLNLILGAFSAAHGGAAAGAEAADLPEAPEAPETPEAADASDLTGGEAGSEIEKGAPFKFNVYCLCLALVVLGAVGIYATNKLSGLLLPLTLAGGLVLALAAYFLLYRFVVRPLQKNKAPALSTASLLHRHARVSFSILKDRPGKIETTDAVGASISYSAEMDPDICKAERIEEGEEVIITEVRPETHLCYVIPADYNPIANKPEK